MALQPTSTKCLPSVGHVQVPGKTLLFCNGIMNTPEQARESARIISEAFGGRKVFVYYNPTTLNGYLEDDIEYQNNLSASLYTKIRGFISAHKAKKIDTSEISVTLFVHSHGAVVTKRALEVIAALKPSLKKNIRIYAFGGADMIPNQLAHRVLNVVFQGDIIAQMGNIRDNSGMVLDRTKQIREIMREQKVSLEVAIVKQAYEDLRKELDPVLRCYRSESHRERSNKDERYKKIFDQKNEKALEKALETDPFFLRRIKKYKKFFDNYAIVILRSDPFQHPKYKKIKKHSDINELLSNLLKNISKGSTAIVSYALANHSFHSYAPAIQQIASQADAV